MIEQPSPPPRPEFLDPGWYRPEGEPAGSQRWWDGQQWSDSSRTMATASPPRERWIFAGDHVQLGSIGARFAARVLDTAVIGLVAVGVLAASFTASLGDAGRSDLIIPVLVAVILTALNEIVGPAVLGATPAKRLFGLHMVTPNGQTVDNVTAAVRWAAVTLPTVLSVLISPATFAFACGVVGLWSVYNMNESPRRRSVHDLAAATLVVVRP